MEQAISKYIRNAEKLYDFLNGEYFNSELTRPVIFINEDTTKGAYGWYTPFESWEGKENKYKEIVITADYLDQNDWTGTLLHEMVHQYNWEIRKVQDTSRSGTYHNSEFKKGAIEHGLKCEKTQKYGWSKTELTEETKRKIEKFLGESKITIHRNKPKQRTKSRNSHSIKYICPICGQTIRSTKPVFILCGICNEEMMVELNG